MKVNILVVDDRPEGLMAVEAVLSSQDYNLVLASSGAEALKQLLKYDFAVILMDVQMPEMNGFETAEIIKTREKSRNTPIIFMSAISQDEKYVYEGYEVGAIDYLLKPFDPYILKSKVSTFVDLYIKNALLLEQAKKIHENEVNYYARALDKLELESLRKYQYLADSIPQIVFRLLPGGNHEYFNKVWFEYTGFSFERTQELGWKEAIHPDDISHLFASLNESNRVDVECRIKSRSGEYRWHLVQVGAEKYHETYQVDAWLGTATDIEERKRNEGFQKLLAETGEILISSLNYKETFEKVADLAIQEIADWCCFEIFNEGHELELVTCKSKESLENFGPDFGDKTFINEGRSLLKTNYEHDKLGSCSLIIVPLVARGVTLGAMTIAYTTSLHSYDEGHLKTAEELGRRSAMALENSVLYDVSQKAIELRNDFLSIASHELNTPMTSLKMQLQMAKKFLTSKNLNKMTAFETSINSSLKQVDRLIGLIQVLLDVSKIQSGKFHLLYTECVLSEIVQDVVERNKDIFVNAGCELTVGTVPPVNVLWDRMRIEQVIVNLLVNAMKYAPGKIELNFDQRNDLVMIEVKDHGKGIDKNKLDTIFDRFTRATGESVAGLGLGLFIVKQIVEEHRGEIQVESSPLGSSFKVILPLEVNLSDKPGVKIGMKTVPLGKHP